MANAVSNNPDTAIFPNSRSHYCMYGVGPRQGQAPAHRMHLARTLQCYELCNICHTVVMLGSYSDMQMFQTVLFPGRRCCLTLELLRSILVSVVSSGECCAGWCMSSLILYGAWIARPPTAHTLPARVLMIQDSFETLCSPPRCIWSCFG